MSEQELPSIRIVPVPSDAELMLMADTAETVERLQAMMAKALYQPGDCIALEEKPTTAAILSYCVPAAT